MKGEETWTYTGTISGVHSFPIDFSRTIHSRRIVFFDKNGAFTGMNFQFIQSEFKSMEVRGWTQTCHEAADILQMTGTTYLYDGLASVGNNYIVNIKFRMDTDEGGVWAGNCVLAANTLIIKCVGHGEGIYEGLELHWFPAPNFGNTTSFTGTILDHRQ